MGIGDAIAGVAQGAALIAATKLQVDAANKAVDVQAQLTREGIAFQQGIFDTIRADLAPFKTFGTAALDPLSGLLFGDPNLQANLEATPGFQFALSQGVRAVDAGAANTGLVNSGARAKALTEFGQGLAGQTLTQERQALFGAVTIGQNAAAQTGAAAQNLGNTTQDALSQLGTTSANAALARGSAFSNLATGLGGIVSEGVGKIG